eukprot:2541605-Prymnesium_polylepis.1
MDQTERAIDPDAFRHAEEQLGRVERGVGEPAAARHQVDDLCDDPLLDREPHVGKWGECRAVDRAIQREVRVLASLVSSRQRVARADGARTAPEPRERRLSRPLVELPRGGILQRERGQLGQPDVV